MPEPNLEAFKTILKILAVAPQLYDKLQEWKGKPSKGDREKLVQYCRRIDERRVFRAAYDEEDLMSNNPTVVEAGDDIPAIPRRRCF